MVNFPEWGNGITKETPQILPPKFFYFQKIYIIKNQRVKLKKKINTKFPPSAFRLPPSAFKIILFILKSYKS